MDLAPIKNRLAKATPGEWELGYHYHVQGATFCKCFEGYGPLVWQGVREINGVLMQTHVHRRGSHMLFMNDGIYARNDDLGGVYVADTDAMSDADLDLIVHAPADLAALLDKVTELEEENIALRARIDAVEQIHKPEEYENPNTHSDGVMCTHCYTEYDEWAEYPCPTVQALGGHDE